MEHLCVIRRHKESIVDAAKVTRRVVGDHARVILGCVGEVVIVYVGE